VETIREGPRWCNRRVCGFADLPDIDGRATVHVAAGIA
jgi:hypothetical protein